MRFPFEPGWYLAKRWPHPGPSSGRRASAWDLGFYSWVGLRQIGEVAQIVPDLYDPEMVRLYLQVIHDDGMVEEMLSGGDCPLDERWSATPDEDEIPL